MFWKIIAVIVLLFCMISIPALAQENKEDKIRWLKEYEKAKAKLETWETIRTAGIGSCLLSFALYLTNKKEVTEYGPYGLIVTKKEAKNIYLISGAIGAGISLIGFAFAGPTRGEVKALELEGKEKGYMTASIIPIRKGLAIRLTFAF